MSKNNVSSNRENILVAVPSKGRLKSPALEILERIGIKPRFVERAYFCETSNPKVSIVFLRAVDIPMYVYYGAVDLGITGHDMVLERNVDVYELLGLGFGLCKLVLAVPNDSNLKSVKDFISTTRVATEQVNNTSEFFKRIGKEVEIIGLKGSVEISPSLGLVDAIVDLTSTGQTLKMHNLISIETILESSAVLICNKVSFRIKSSTINWLLNAIKNSKKISPKEGR